MAESETKRSRAKKLQRHPRVLWRRLWRFWPLAVWLLMVLVVVWLYAGTVHYGSITGVVETLSEDVAPMQTSRLLQLYVTPGDRVEAGNIIARMDTAVLDATLAAEEAAALDVAQNIARYQESILRMARQFETAISDAQADYLQEKRAQAEAQAELTELQRELERREKLLERKLIREEDVNILRPQIAALETATDAYPEIVEAYRDRVETARKEYQDMRRWLDLEEGEDIGAAIKRKREASEIIMDTAAELRRVQSEGYILRATRDGQVSRVYYNPGEVVAAGVPVARIVSGTSDRIIGFLQETAVIGIKEGQQVRVWNRGVAGTARVMAVIESLAPEVQALPGRLNRLGGPTLRGRRLVLRIVGPHNLVPGETVEILIDRPTWLRWFDDILNRAVQSVTSTKKNQNHAS